MGNVEMLAPYAVMLNLLGVDGENTFVENYPKAMAKFPMAKFHSYEKGARLGRKMGHITLLGSDWRALIEQGKEARDILYGRAE
jgi:5-(carboxyamino)imidazole ribonucleotide synthase